MSTTYLKVKFALDDESAEIISVNQEIKCKCYEDSLKARRGIYGSMKHYGVNFVELDPRRDFIDY